MARRNACGSPPAHRSVGDGVEIEASLVVGVGVGSVVGLVCLLLFCWFPGEGKFFIFHGFLFFFSFLRSFSIFFVLSTIYYRYCNIILLKLGLNFPRSGGGGASRAGKNPKRPTLFEKSRDPLTRDDGWNCQGPSLPPRDHGRHSSSRIAEMPVYASAMVTEDLSSWGKPLLQNSDAYLSGTWPETEALLRSVGLYHGIHTDAQSLQQFNWTHRVSECNL